jgi:two-component system, NarL family, nitrate/nitrite response regulator NarL
MKSRTHVALVSSNQIVRLGIQHIIEQHDFDVVVSESSVAKLASSRLDGVDLVVVSMEPTDDMTAVCTELGLACPDARRVLAAADFSIDDVVGGVELGVDGLILSSASGDQLVASLRLVMLGERILPGKVVDDLVGNHPSDTVHIEDFSPAEAGLSHREAGILGHLVNGDANKVIARNLNIAEATVKVHVKTILRKLRVTNRTQAAIWAIQHRANAMERGAAACRP